MQEVVIVAASRTPLGSFLGSLAPLTAPQLGAAAIAAVLRPQQVLPEQVLMGCVLQAGLGQAPARQASLGAGVPEHVGAVTLNKVCGSGLRAVMDAHNAIACGEFGAVVAGGMESMSGAPHLLERARQGLRLGDAGLTDALLKDGLTDASSGRSMGLCAEACAEKYAFSRAQQDAFATDSYRKARAAVDSGAFAAEIIAVEVPQRRGPPQRIATDEEPHAAPLEKMATLRPAFSPTGSITAANASKISDGAAALLLMSAAQAQAQGCRPRARLLGQASFAQAPQWYTTAPAQAARQACARANLQPRDIDLWEVNEAFAVVAMAALVELEIEPQRLNLRGGAIALGHPIGASGARLLVTLIHSLEQQGKRTGCAVLCIGGGEAVAVVVEKL